MEDLARVVVDLAREVWALARDVGDLALLMRALALDKIPTKNGLVIPANAGIHLSVAQRSMAPNASARPAPNQLSI